MTTPCRLHVAQLCFAYPGRPLFDEWSHDFRAGLTWVRGKNGDGKSTLLRLLGGALSPRSGTLTVQKTDAESDPQGYRRQVFWCGPERLVFDHLSPVEFFGFMAHLFPSFDPCALAQHATGFQLTEHLHGRLRGLSTGTQRKVWVAAALAAGTVVTLLDEPANGMDADALQYLHQVLQQRAADTHRATVIVSHDGLGPAEAMADQVDLTQSSEPEKT